MKIDLRKEKFELIESCFTDIKEAKSNIPNATKRMEQHLEDVFHKHMTVTVIQPKSPQDTFFVMSIFPSQSTMDALVTAILKESSDQALKQIWDETDEWIIEIDYRLFTTTNLGITAKELTALLLHEIGHIVYSNSVPQRISRVMKFELAKASIQTKAILQNSLFSGVLQLPILNACCYDQYKTSGAIKKELKADVFVIKMGYGKELQSILEKFLSTDAKKVKGTHSHINKSESDVDQDMQNTVHFSIDVINDFQKRKINVAKKNIGSLGFRIPSVYIQNVLADLSDKLIHSKNPAVTDNTKMEQVCDIANREVHDYYMREFFEFRTKRFKRMDARMLDYIETQAQSIKNNDDKMILVNLIYTYLDQINYRIDLLKNPTYSKDYVIPESLDILLRYKQRLEKVREFVMYYKIPESRYGLSITYPEGYDG